jgi:hypothetical protein
MRREMRGFSGLNSSEDMASVIGGRLGAGGSGARSETAERTSAMDGICPTGRGVTGLGMTGVGEKSVVRDSVRSTWGEGVNVGPVGAVGSSVTGSASAARDFLDLGRGLRTVSSASGAGPVAVAVTPDRTSPDTRTSTPWRTSGSTTAVGRRVTSMEAGGWTMVGIGRMVVRRPGSVHASPREGDRGRSASERAGVGRTVRPVEPDVGGRSPTPLIRSRRPMSRHSRRGFVDARDDGQQPVTCGVRQVEQLV